MFEQVLRCKVCYVGNDVEQASRRNAYVDNKDFWFSIKRRISVSPNIYLLHSSSANDDAALELLKKTKGIILAQKNHETENQKQRQREMASALAMLIIGAPLYFYHWKMISKENNST